jgi:hypothetical protein
MKKYPLSLYIALSLAITAVVPAVTNAQEDNGQLPPPPPGVGVNASATIGQQIRANFEGRIQNTQMNGNFRNAMLENRLGRPPRQDQQDNQGMNDQEDGSNTPRDMHDRPDFASSTDGRPPFMGNRGERGDRFSSSSDEFGSTTMRDGRGPRGDRGLHLGEFKNRQENIVHQMDTALSNLNQIRDRINSRITKEQANGVDMSASITLLATADAKIAIASTSIASLEAYTPAASSTASTTIDLNTPRQLAENAIKSVGDARKALQDVVISIAHALGIDLDREATTTVATTTVTVTASTTASTTTN